MEIVISAFFWYTFVQDFFFSDKFAMESRFAHLNTVFWMRNLRAFEFMTELQDYQMIVVTTKNLTKPILTKVLFVYVVYFIYACIGQKLYGGLISSDIVTEKAPNIPPYYYLMNFNSFSSGMVTLFHFMVVNNWNYTIDMYASVMDQHQWVPVFFFGTFWVAVVLILLNVVLSMVLEIYSSVEPEVQR